MKKILLKILVLNFCVLCTFNVSARKQLPAGIPSIPSGIAGFELGEPVGKFASRLEMNQYFVGIEHPYLKAYRVLPFAGFRGGYVLVGACTGKEAVVRIKLKYKRYDKEFFKKLKRAIEKRFGKSSEYRGDPFHVYVAWKWRFKKSDGKIISMLLERYEGDDEEYSSGTSIKLTLVSELKREMECYRKKTKESASATGEPSNFKQYLPY